MPFCTRCGSEVLVTDRYCPNCGQMAEGRMTVSAVPGRQSLSPQRALQGSPAISKNPAGAATLNFFFPGLGYVYLGLNHDAGEVIFGGLVFVLYFIGFEVGYLIDLITYVPSTTPVSVSPYAALILLAFLLPFAFAYDGYRRAKSP